jgi:hypothetical protein
MFDGVCSTDRWWCVADRGAWAMFLANILWHRGMDHKQAALRPNSRSKSHGKQASPPSSGRTVHAQGLKSWGGRFIRGSFIWALEPWIADYAARPPRHAPRSGGYCGRSSRFRNGCARGPLDMAARLGPRPFSIGVVKSLVGSFVWVLKP